MSKEQISVASSSMSIEDAKPETQVVELSPARRWSLLAILCFAQFMDIVSFVGLLTIASRVARDLNISTANVTWVSARGEAS